MTSASTVTRVATDEFDWASDEGAASVVQRVLRASEEADGAAPLDEAALLRLRRHGLEGSALWLAGEQGFAWSYDGALAVVVDPGSRGAGTGTELAAAAVATSGDVTAWSHGNHPAAAALAER